MKYISALFLTFTLLAPIAAADDRSTEEAVNEGPFLDVVDVNVVNIEVYVTDKKGNRITGLTKDDFALYEDGKPVQISNFYAVEGGAARDGTTLETVEVPAVPEDPLRVGTEDEVPEDQQLHLVLYVDNFNLHPFSRNRVFGFVRTFLRQNMRPGDRAMLISYDRELHTRHPFTGDMELIASALYDIEDISAQGVHNDSARRDILRDITESEQILEVRGQAITYAESIFNDLSFSIDAIKDVVESLAGLPGRKAILYISDGLPMRAGEDIFWALDSKFRTSGSVLESHRYDLSRRYQELANHANANRTSFYTVDAAGLRTYSYIDPSNHLPGEGAHIDQIHFSNLQSTLQLMADETGGLSIYNTNNFGPMLTRVADDFNNYYSLGYSPVGTSEGRYHHLEVKLDGPRGKGLRVRHREGYRDKPVTTRMADTTLATLHYGYQKNGLGVQLEFGQTRREDDGQYLVPLRVKIPMAEISFLPQEDFQRGRLRVFVAARDSNGGTAPVQEVPVPIDIPMAEFERAQQQYYQYEISLLMRRGSQVVAVGVRDEIGAGSSFISRGITVGG